MLRTEGFCLFQGVFLPAAPGRACPILPVGTWSGMLLVGTHRVGDPGDWPSDSLMCMRPPPMGVYSIWLFSGANLSCVFGRLFYKLC